MGKEWVFIAGPVLACGLTASVIYGLLYYIFA